MNRRGFLKGCVALLPLPAFVKASSLWLPPEKAFKPLTMDVIQEAFALGGDEDEIIWGHSWSIAGNRCGKTDYMALLAQACQFEYNARRAKILGWLPPQTSLRLTEAT